MTSETGIRVFLAKNSRVFGFVDETLLEEEHMQRSRFARLVVDRSLVNRDLPL